MVLAALGQDRRQKPPVRAYGKKYERARHPHAASERAKPAFSRSSRSERSTPDSPSREARSPESGRATTTKSCPCGSSPATAQKASLSSRFTRLRSTAPPPCPPPAP